MKKDIHPQYHKTAIKCACGAILETGATKKDMEVEICSQCHPFFTGQQKFVDVKGRIDKFKQKVEQGKTYTANKAEKIAAAKKKTAKTN